MRRISVKPPARPTSGWAMSGTRRSARFWKSDRVARLTRWESSCAPDAWGGAVYFVAKNGAPQPGQHDRPETLATQPGDSVGSTSRASLMRALPHFGDASPASLARRLMIDPPGSLELADRHRGNTLRKR